MSDPHTLAGQAQRAKRLREQIESLKSGTRAAAESPESLREQLEKRAREVRQTPEERTKTP